MELCVAKSDWKTKVSSYFLQSAKDRIEKKWQRSVLCAKSNSQSKEKSKKYVQTQSSHFDDSKLKILRKTELAEFRKRKKWWIIINPFGILQKQR